MKKIIILLTFLFFLPMPSFAETYWGGELPDVTDTTLKADMTVSGDIYTYAYTIISGKSNNGKIKSLDVDIRRREGSLELSGEGLENGRGYGESSSAYITADATTPEMIPVGLHSPDGWVSGLDIYGQAGWGGVLLSPGSTIGGFQMSSRGLPGLRDFRIAPNLIAPSAGHTEVEEGTELVTLEAYKIVANKAAYMGQIIGPVAPPAEFVAVDFIDYIISIKHKAADLGWITNKGIVQSLDAKLNIAKRSIANGSTSSAKNVLEAFLNQLEAQGCESYDSCGKGKHIRPEAYALLKYNVRYLIDKI